MPAGGSEPRTPRNIIIFSDGTGQRGGLHFDEERTNVYKLYRAARVAPDSAIDPNQQVAFYDPGLGTLSVGGSMLPRLFRRIYNFISQATGLGLTRNMLDCYAALIRLWQPGDRIFLFGFSRGAYTVRCLASVICMCGIPTSDRNGKPLRRDKASSTTIASRAVKSIYQHVSSPRDEKYVEQRKALAAAFRKNYGASDAANSLGPNAHPHFIGVFDTVASLSNTGSLVILCTAYITLHIGLAAVLAFVAAHIGFLQGFEYWFWYWFGWIAVWTICAVVAAYVYTHLKFALHLPGYHFWDVIHLTDFRQRFYDQNLNQLVVYARHAISIDERRNDFKRVPWVGPQATFTAANKIDPFEQLWFAGNHADIGGGYPENESRLSDLALSWMLSQASHPKLDEEKLLVDNAVLHLNGRSDGMQHDETQTSMFRWAKKTLREPVPDATLDASVLSRFELSGVQQYDVTALYRPEPLRNHQEVSHYYIDTPLPHTTCWQRIALRRDRIIKSAGDSLQLLLSRVVGRFYPHDWNSEEAMNSEHKQLTPDSIVSFLGLAFLVVFLGAAAWLLLFRQIVPWLREGVWHSYPISDFFVIRTDWIGLQLILDWLLALPASLVFALIGLLLFRIFGLFSARLYQWASRTAGQTITPAQSRA